MARDKPLSGQRKVHQRQELIILSSGTSTRMTDRNIPIETMMYNVYTHKVRLSTQNPGGQGTLDEAISEVCTLTVLLVHTNYRFLTREVDTPKCPHRETERKKERQRAKPPTTQSPPPTIPKSKYNKFPALPHSPQL